MWIQEIEFDISTDKEQPMLLNEGGINDMGDMTAIEIRSAAEQEFGDYAEDLTDPENPENVIGWKFRSDASYEDPTIGKEFVLETWVILHENPPKVISSYYVIKPEELSILSEFNEKITLDDLNDIVHSNEDNDVPLDDIEDTPGIAE